MTQLKGVSVNAFYFFPIFLTFFLFAEGVKVVADDLSITALPMMNSNFRVVKWSLTVLERTFLL